MRSKIWVALLVLALLWAPTVEAFLLDWLVIGRQQASCWCLGECHCNDGPGEPPPGDGGGPPDGGPPDGQQQGRGIPIPLFFILYP